VEEPRWRGSFAGLSPAACTPGRSQSALPKARVDVPSENTFRTPNPTTPLALPKIWSLAPRAARGGPGHSIC
jgi:hypothetical protein